MKKKIALALVLCSFIPLLTRCAEAPVAEVQTVDGGE
jgi:hypothetical protein